MPQKKQQHLVGDSDCAVTFDYLSVDLQANIFSFLPPNDIMRSRRINISVNSVENYNTMVVMTRAMPNLQQITLGSLGWDNNHKYNDGEDPDEERASRFANWTTHDIEIISNFSKLQTLGIHAGLNGRYPALFSFPLLLNLRIKRCYCLKLDLEMLAGFPMLKELECTGSMHLTAHISSLRVLKDTLEKVHI